MNKEDESTNLVTLSRHILHSEHENKEANGDLTLLLVSIQVACKTGLADQVNVQGEDVKKLDVVANEIFINCLTSCGKVKAMVSEENKDAFIIDIPSNGLYYVVFDPLDGSSNIDAGVSIGTIFGIYKLDSPNDLNLLRAGSEMVASGYAMYGSFTILVLAIANGGVNGYTLDPTLGEFILTNPNIKIPDSGKIYSVNEGNSQFWTNNCKRYFDSLKAKNKPYSSRYVGSMVADVHRTLLYGGIFAYPGDSKSPSGKLRLLYECFPMAFIIEAAGGMATDGFRRILEIKPCEIHDRSPIALGSLMDVNEYVKYCQEK